MSQGATVFHTSMYGRFIEIQSNLSRKNFIERTKALISLAAVVAMEIMLKEKLNPSILKYNLSSRTKPSIFRSVTPALLEKSNETS